LDHDLLWVPQLAVGTLVGVLLLRWLLRWFLARRKAAALERALLKKPAAGPPERPEVAELRAEMAKAVEALKRGAPGGKRGGRAALYALPWYVIVGPSAAGKTTALTKSGLTFATEHPGGAKVRGTSGTRNCDWWFSHEAILLDTAGRFSTEDDDRDEWLAFLKTLHRLRPDRPLEGLLVAVNVDEVLAKSDGERAALAAKLRARLDEVLHHLEIELPIYLLLTKTDLISGFVEFFADLSKTQRGQIWGASFEIGDPRLEDVARAVEAEFDVLVRGLHARLIDRLPHERDPSRRSRLMQFPVEFRGLRRPLSLFVEALCRGDDRRQVPILRGFYFTSGTQVGRPIDSVLAGMMRGFGIRSRTFAQAGPAPESQSYFLTDLFRSVILPDRNVAVRSAASDTKRSRRELRLAIGALVLSAFFLVPCVLSYVANMRTVQEVTSAAHVLERDGAQIPGTPADPIEALRDTLDHLERDAAGLGIPGWFEPTRASRDLREPVRKAYVLRLDGAIRPRLVRELERSFGETSKAADLADSPTTPLGSPTQLRLAYENVELYATLADPEGHVDAAWTAGRIAQMWKDALEGQTLVADERLKRHVSGYLAALAPLDLAWPKSASFNRARRHLLELGIGDLPYHWLLRAASDTDPLYMSDFADRSSLEYLSCAPDRMLVEGAYTADSWKKKIGPKLDSSDPWPREAVIQDWALGGAVADRALDKAQLRARYYSEYSTTWLGIFDKCKVRAPDKFDTVWMELRDLNGPAGYYETLFGQFKNNAVADAKKINPRQELERATAGCQAKLIGLISPDKEDAGAETKAPILSPVQKDFQPLRDLREAKEGSPDKPALETYRTALLGLSAALKEKGPPAGQDLDVDLKILLDAKLGIEKALAAEEGPTATRLRDSLVPPIEGSIRVLKGGGWNEVTSEWKAGVLNGLQERLQARFPFNRANARVPGVNYDDFIAFLQPDSGLLWKFVREHLSDYVVSGADGFHPKPGADPLNEDVLKCLNIAKEISDAFFGMGERGLKFAIKVNWDGSGVTVPKFVIGDKAIALSKDEWSDTLIWTGQAVHLEWTLNGNPTLVPGRADSFALFDFFRKAGGIRPGKALGTYVADGPDVSPLTVTVRADRPEALRQDFFSRLKCPTYVGAGLKR
ncbi:MAG TPA: type VI secretion system membrane subunit TssM, partial [Polyangiaceae bacterium]|nr:type VI secretion system membrane subunit TssM [Polyangiaceae bacterium]